MKKMFFLVLLPAILYCQPIDSFFPKVGYYDYFRLNKDYDPIPNIVPNHYYFDKMKDLGLTHLVTYGDLAALQTSYNYGLKIIDDNMNWFATNPNSPYYKNRLH
jgi:hypothetical protein